MATCSAFSSLVPSLFAFSALKVDAVRLHSDGYASLGHVDGVDDGLACIVSQRALAFAVALSVQGHRVVHSCVAWRTLRDQLV